MNFFFLLLVIIKGSIASPLVLFSVSVYVNVSSMYLRSLLSSQPLTILAPWVLFHNRWSIPMVLPGVTASYFLACFPVFPPLLTPQ